MTPQKLRFSAFLQFFAAGLFGVTFLIRAFAIGVDALTLVIAFVGVLALIAGVVLRRRAAEMETRYQ